MQPSVHIPVLKSEVLELGRPSVGEQWVDGTGGGGGHSQLFLDAIGQNGRLIILDRDPSAAERLQQQFQGKALVNNNSYDQLEDVLQQHGLSKVDGILLDLGLSSDQLASESRGFSFQTEGELDMRFDPTRGQPAWQWLARVDERTLANTIFEFGEERYSRRIARRIVQARGNQAIRTVGDLRELIYSCVPGGKAASENYRRVTAARKHSEATISANHASQQVQNGTTTPKASTTPKISMRRRHGRIDPATRTFQALRIAINEELTTLRRALEQLPQCLNPGGRLLVISFHSLEDRIVKCCFRDNPLLEVLTRKPIQASPEEIASNFRSRSAKLRVARLIDDAS